MSFALRTLLYGAIALSLFVPWIFSGIEPEHRLAVRG